MKILLYAPLLLLVFGACKKKVLEVSAPELHVTTEKTSYKVGEEVRFKITGNPQLITFYSGEALHDYAFRDGRIVTPGPLKLSFQTAVEFGTQPNQLSILASSNFNGGNSFAEVQAATWTDITPRFTLAGNAVFTYSKEADIADLAVKGKPLFIAFRYKVKDQGANGVGRTWRVENLLLSDESSIGTRKKGDITSAAFRIIDQQPDVAPARSTLTSSRISLVAHAVTPANRNIETENWAVSKGFSVDEEDYGPDRPLPVKGFADSRLNEYKHTYVKEGVYHAVFLGYNTSISGSEARQIEIAVTIQP